MKLLALIVVGATCLALPASCVERWADFALLDKHLAGKEVSLSTLTNEASTMEDGTLKRTAELAINLARARKCDATLVADMKTAQLAGLSYKSPTRPIEGMLQPHLAKAFELCSRRFDKLARRTYNYYMRNEKLAGLIKMVNGDTSVSPSTEEIRKACIRLRRGRAFMFADAKVVDSLEGGLFLANRQPAFVQLYKAMDFCDAKNYY